jgi:peroxiredoxin
MLRSRRPLLLLLGGLGLALGLGVFVLVSCGLGGYLLGSRAVRSDNNSGSSLQAGMEAPDFQMTTIYGKTQHLSDLRSQPVLLNFWATWCGPCVVEVPILQSYADKYAQELVIVGVNADEPRSDVLDFTEDHALTFPIVLDPDSSIQDLYRIRAFPTSYFIDAQGIIQAVHIGSLTSELLDDYLAEIGVGK